MVTLLTLIILVWFLLAGRVRLGVKSRSGGRTGAGPGELLLFYFLMRGGGGGLRLFQACCVYKDEAVPWLGSPEDQEPRPDGFVSLWLY
jgi:hypothetical protein